MTDGQTEGQNYDSQDRARIAASHGKNHIHKDADKRTLASKQPDGLGESSSKSSRLHIAFPGLPSEYGSFR